MFSVKCFLCVAFCCFVTSLPVQLLLCEFGRLSMSTIGYNKKWSGVKCKSSAKLANLHVVFRAVSKESQNRYSKSAKDWGWREFLQLHTLFDQEAGFLVGDSVVFAAEVLVLKEVSEVKQVQPGAPVAICISHLLEPSCPSPCEESSDLAANLHPQLACIFCCRDFVVARCGVQPVCSQPSRHQCMVSITVVSANAMAERNQGLIAESKYAGIRCQHARGCDCGRAATAPVGTRHHVHEQQDQAALAY